MPSLLLFAAIVSDSPVESRDIRNDRRLHLIQSASQLVKERKANGSTQDAATKQNICWLKQNNCNGQFAGVVPDGALYLTAGEHGVRTTLGPKPFRVGTVSSNKHEHLRVHSIHGQSVEVSILGKALWRAPEVSAWDDSTYIKVIDKRNSAPRHALPPTRELGVLHCVMKNPKCDVGETFESEQFFHLISVKPLIVVEDQLMRDGSDIVVVKHFPPRVYVASTQLVLDNRLSISKLELSFYSKRSSPASLSAGDRGSWLRVNDRLVVNTETNSFGGLVSHYPLANQINWR